MGFKKRFWRDYMVYKLHKLRSRLNTITKTIVHDSEMLMENVLGQDDFINSLQKIHAGSKYLLERINDIPDSSNALLLSSMAHELRTPLCFIGYSEMLLEDAEESGQDNLIPDLQKIHTAGKHMLGMINDVLDLSKLETGKMDLRIEGFNIDIVLDEIISTVQPMVETKANTLEIKRPQILGDMQTDITKLRQILFICSAMPRNLPKGVRFILILPFKLEPMASGWFLT
jgi:signal transduction histidine kinase